MNMQKILSVIAGVLMIVGCIPYIITILQGKTKPKKVTWLVWALLDIITVTGMYWENAINYQIVAAVLSSNTIFLLSLKYGVPEWTQFDSFCLVSAIFGIVAWWAMGNPMYGILISLTVMFIGSMPTFISAWNYPQREDKLAWTICLFSSMFAVIAVPCWTLVDSSQPLTFLLICIVMVYILYARPILEGYLRKN